MDSIIWEIIKHLSDIILIVSRNAAGIYSPESAPELNALTDTLRRILTTERDNLDALVYLYNHMIKDKPSTETTDFAKGALAKYREDAKLIK